MAKRDPLTTLLQEAARRATRDDCAGADFFVQEALRKYHSLPPEHKTMRRLERINRAHDKVAACMESATARVERVFGVSRATARAALAGWRDD